MQITPTTTTGTTAAPGSNRIGLADDFDSFLLLLTTQLQNQDPLSPLDATRFTEQLVQFSAVEQSIKTNDVLGELVSLVRADQLARSIDYLGAEVAAAGRTIHLGASGAAQVNYRLDQAAERVTIEIYDAAGRPVATRVGATGVGNHVVAWDGRAQNGAALPEGMYRFEITATDAKGQTIPVTTTIRGRVDGVEIDGDRLMLSIDGVLMPLESVTSIRRPPAEA